MEPAAAPRIVGRYALYDVIASGGMASVHLGRLTGPVGFSRTVAIKRLHENYARDPQFVAMFLDEARIVARIRHPNVIPTLDVVALEQELLIVMEYVAGESLFYLLRRARAARTPTPIGIIADVLVNVLHGLHAAHDATSEKGEALDIVHRDVSPQNILVGADGVARVLDFGVAMAVGRSQDTRDGQIKGKLRYMAPEQIRGQGVTRSADVYAASVVLWEALTSKSFLVAETAAELMYRALEVRPSPPSALRPDVGRALDEVVMRGLARDPAHRYPTARAMADALEAAVMPVGRSAVGNWVLESARDGIELRARLVAGVESDVSQVPAPIPRASAPPLLLEPRATDGPSIEPSSASLARPLSSVGPPPRSSSVHLAVMGGVAAAVLGVLGALWLTRSNRMPAPNEARPAATATAETSAASSPAPPAASAPVTAGTPRTPGPEAQSAAAPASAKPLPPPSTKAAQAPKPASSKGTPPAERIYVRD